MRTARQNKPGSVYHVISRFVDRDWFFRRDEERSMYLCLLGRALAKTDWRCFSFALMSNHIHLGVLAGRQPLGSWTKAVNAPFAIWMNQRHNRLGSIFADRPKDHPILPSKVGELIAYHHNNPVRANVVSHAFQSTWTSHRAYLGRARYDWLDLDLGFELSGLRNGAELDRFVRKTPGESGELRLERFRRVTRRGNITLATPMATRDGTIVPLVARPFATIRVNPRALLEAVAATLGISMMLLCSQRRLPVVVAARAIAVHVALAVGITVSDVASVLSVTKQSVSRIAKTALPPASIEITKRILDEIEQVISRASESQTD
jgi:hypothetical protein